MVDRDARDKLAKKLRAYMNDEITAKELVNAAEQDTDDRLLADLQFHFIFFFDDEYLTDHLVETNEEGWKFYNRLLLLLESDTDYVESPPERRGRRVFTLRNFVAAASLIIYIAFATQVRWGIDLVALGVPFGIVAAILHSLADRSWEEEMEKRIRESEYFFPFETFPQLAAARRKLPQFRKEKFRAEVKRRGRFTLHNINILPLWCDTYVNGFLKYMGMIFLFGPLVLLIQSIPTYATEAVPSKTGQTT